MTTRFLKSSENINGLPIGFQEVEYLETTNQQNNDTTTNNVAYIDTGVVPDNTTKIECRVQFTTLISGNSNEALFGTTGVSSSDPARFAFGFASLSPYTNFYMGLGTQNLTTSVTRDTNVHTFVIDASTSSWKIDDTTGTFSNPGEVAGAGSIYLFARNYAAYDYANKPANAKTYYCKIWKGGSLVRDLIPALNPAGRPCMYDLVEKKAYYNLGSGEFTYGRKIIPVEYLESTGTQYIDTGYIPKPTSTYKSTFQLTTITTTAGNWFCVFGSVESNNSTFTELFLPRASGGGDVNQILAGSHNSSYLRTDYPWAVNTKYNFEMAPTVVLINGVSQGSISVDSSITCSHSIYLFARHEYNDAVRYNVSAKIHSFTIYEGNTLVRDYIPCIDENNVGYMFDKVTHTCYLNAGTGTFSYGKKLYSSKVRLYKDSGADNDLPVGFKRVEYLESSGGPYIDTGIGVKSNTVVKAIFSIASTATGRSYFGARNSTNERFQIVNSFGIGSGYFYNASIYPIANQKYEIEMHANGDVYLDGVKRNATNGTFSPVAFDRSLYIFSTNYYDGSGVPSASTFWKVQILEGDVLVRNFIPALDTTNTPCMYDTVTQTAFYNQGSGEFTYGAIIPNKVRFPQSTEIRFPKGYAEVEYLASNGNQYIDTNYTINTATDEVELYYQLIDGTQYKWIFGEHDTNARFGLGSGDGTNKRNVAYGASTVQKADTYFMSSQHYYKASTAGVYIDGTKMTNYSSFSSTSTIYLFNLNLNNLDIYCSQTRIWRYRHKRDGVLIRDFIPALDPNGRPCMWDVVTKQPFYNQGTGEFTYGRSIQQVEYIESMGTQYVNTGIKLTNNYSVELDYQLTQATQSRTGLFGALSMTGSNQGRIGSILSPSNQQLEHGYGAGNDYWQQGLPDTNRHILYQKQNKTYFDGTLIHTFDTATFNLTISAYLGNFAFTNYTPAKAKYYRSKWWEGETLVRDYVPAIDSNNVSFMFDRVTHTIFDNAGTGSFTYGSPVPNKIRN